MENYLCDVTLVCEDKQIKPHKLIISSFSPVLRNILKLNQSPHPLTYLRKFKYRTLPNLLFLKLLNIFVRKMSCFDGKECQDREKCIRIAFFKIT